MIQPWPVKTKLMIIKTEPGMERILSTLVIAAETWRPCCSEHGGWQHVILEEASAVLPPDGMYPIKWMKPWLDDLDINDKDVDAIRGLTTPNKSDALSKVADQMTKAVNRLANNYPQGGRNES